MELQQAFDPKRLAVSVLPHSIVHSLDVYRSICSKVLAKVPCTVCCGLALSFGTYGKCVLSLLVSCVFCLCLFGCFFWSGAFRAPAARVSWRMLSREKLTSWTRALPTAHALH